MGESLGVFESLKEKYPGVKLAEYLIVQYFKYGSFYSMEKDFGATHVTIRNNIMKYKDEIMYEKPYMWDMFQYTLKWNKSNPGMASKKARAKRNDKSKGKEPKECEHESKEFTEDVLRKLPKEMEYTKLINIIKDYDTRNLTGNDVVKLAQKHNMKLYNIDLYTGTKKYIKF